MKNAKVGKMVGVALLMAMVVVLQFVSSIIPPIGFVSISLVLIPIVLGAATYGVGAGALLGATFAVVTIINCITGADAGGAMIFQANPVLCIVVVLAKSILAGVVMLTSAFAGAIFMDANSSGLLINLLFILAGLGWATINVNSFPMVVELASGGNVGKYTGYYYTASMSAQIITPILSGVIMDLFGNMRPLFYYATVFAALAIITMSLVKHGDSKVEAK